MPPIDADGPVDIQRPVFASVEMYGQRLTDAAYWRPYVEEICARHGFGPCRELRPGLAGTYPVFVVDERYAVKLFGELFHGGHRVRIEQTMYELLVSAPAIPAPALVGSGRLFDDGADWPWPYLIITAIPGLSLCAVAGQVSFPDKLAVCRWLAPIVHCLHDLVPAPSSPLSLTWHAFDRFLTRQRARCVEHHRQWGSLPERLVRQLDGFLPPLADLVDRRVPPHVLHCDLNADHVLGRFEADRWRPTGIIDFGDAMAGDRLYELVALYIGFCRCDKRLLRAFLDDYGFDQGLRRDFVRRAMSMTLLHEFDVLSDLFRAFPSAARVDSLTELGILLWDLEHPGLPGA